MARRITGSEVSPCCQALALILVPAAQEHLKRPMVSWNAEEDSITFEEARGKSITVTGDCHS